jgi:hypothetical protein
MRAFAEELVYDDKKENIKDAKRQGWRLLERCFPLAFFILTGSPPPKAYLTQTPKARWEILKAERLEREALILLTPEQRVQFAEDEALIRRVRETQNALRGEVRAPRKRKRDAVEETNIRLVEKEAKYKREAYERSSRRVDTPPVRANTVAQEIDLLVTQTGDPIPPGDLFRRLQAAIAAGQFPSPGTASDPVTSEILAVLAKHQITVDQPMPLASTSQVETPTPTALTSQVRTPKATPKRTAASKSKASIPKEVNVEALKTPALLSLISPKPSKGKVIARSKSAAKDAPAVKSKPAKELKVILKRFDDENPGVTLVKLPRPRRKSAINPPSKKLVEAAGKQTARRKSLRYAEDPEPGKGKTPRTEPVNLKGKSKGLFETDSAEEELLKEIPIPTQAPTQAPTPAEEQTLAATNELPSPIPRRSRRLVDSASKSESELIHTAEEEEEVQKNIALRSNNQDKAVKRSKRRLRSSTWLRIPMNHTLNRMLLTRKAHYFPATVKITGTYFFLIS